MIWVNSIDELDYYNNAPGAPCYCEQLVYPSDLLLQATYVNSSSNISVTIDLLSPDGLTIYEDVSTYFEYYSVVFNGVTYVNFRLKGYSNLMCEYKCWILHVVITDNSTGFVIFDKYTNKYCQTTCCDIPRGMTATVTTITNPVTPPQTVPLAIPTTECGAPLIRIEVTFDCLDNQLSNYYGIPAGYTWGYKKITNISGKVRQLPREITRNISYNCNLQRAESFIPYKVYSQGFEGTFPTWKLTELESMFHAKVIGITDFINNYDFQFDGGVIAKPIGENVCWRTFQIDVTLRTCIIRQTFGCTTACENVSNDLTFLVPLNYGGGEFYNENRQIVGGYANLLDWYRGQSYVTDVIDVTPNYENVFAAFRVTGNSYIPTQFYFDSPTPRSRVFGVNSPVSPTIQCVIPDIGEITTEERNCQTPTIGTITTEAITPIEVDVNNFGNWQIQDPTELWVYGDYATLDLESRNLEIVFTSPLTYFINEPIGIIDPEGRPSTPQTINIDSDTVIYIDTDGVIYYTGYPTSYTESDVTVAYNDLYYLL